MTHLESNERRLLLEVVEREARNAVRMLRSFPRHRVADRPPDCPHDARELAWRFVTWERVAHYLLLGRSAGSGPVPATLEEILRAYEDAHAETRLALLRLTRERWAETLRGPVAPGVWERGRRGELLWMAWKSLVHDGEHFAAHLRLAREEDARAGGTATLMETVGAGPELSGAA